MPNIQSAKKRLRQNSKRNLRNTQVRSRVRTFVTKFNKDLSSGDVEKSKESFKLAMRELHIATRKGVLKKNTASRKISRLNKMLKKIALAS